MTDDLVTNHFTSQVISRALVATKMKGNLIKMSLKRSLKMLFDDSAYVILGIRPARRL